MKTFKFYMQGTILIDAKSSDEANKIVNEQLDDSCIFETFVIDDMVRKKRQSLSNSSEANVSSSDNAESLIANKE